MIPMSRALCSCRRRAGWIALGAALLPALLTAATNGTTAKAPLPPARALTLYPTVPYVVRLDGQVVPSGKFYASDRSDAYLILNPRVPGPLLLDVEARTVAILAAAPAERPDGALALPAGAARQPQGRFEIQDASSPTFTVDGKRVRLDYPAPLLALQSAAAIRAYNPEYGRRAAAYRPDAEALKRLAAIKQPVRLRIYFATWCSTCTRVLPNLMKVLDALPGTPFTVEYYGLPEDRSADPEPARMQLQGIPTAVVFRQGKEIGRITGQQWDRPETALRSILAPAP